MRTGGIDIYMVDPDVVQMPVEFCLEFISVARSYGMDSKMEFFNYMVYKSDCVGLDVLIIHL